MANRGIALVNLSGPNSEVISDLFTEWGCHVQHLNSQEGDTQAWQDISLIIFQFSDFSKQELDDCRKVHSEHPHLPLVATSAIISIRNVFELARIGVTEFLSQPFVPRQLKCLLEDCENWSQPEADKSESRNS